MSHSQFHSIEVFILRHAWLNLWDKHMTTGRINQVTILKLGLKDASPYRLALDPSNLGRSQERYSKLQLCILGCSIALVNCAGRLPYSSLPTRYQSSICLVFSLLVTANQ